MHKQVATACFQHMDAQTGCDSMSFRNILTDRDTYVLETYAVYSLYSYGLFSYGLYSHGLSILTDRDTYELEMFAVFCQTFG